VGIGVLVAVAVAVTVSVVDGCGDGTDVAVPVVVAAGDIDGSNAVGVALATLQAGSTISAMPNRNILRTEPIAISLFFFELQC
jgi:hypothetical protein